MTKRISRIMFTCCMISSMYGSAGADLFYTPGEYNSLYNEKIALELEIKSLNEQYRNEKAALQDTITKLRNDIETLKKELEFQKNRGIEDKKSYEKRIAELESMIATLKEKGSSTEKKLVEANNELQKRCEEDMKTARAGFDEERKKLLDEINALKNACDKKISDLTAETANLNNELSELKKLNEKQKQELSRMENQASELEKQLQDEIKKGDIRLKRFHDRLIINIDDRISFDSGQASLKDGVLPALQKIRGILSQYPEYNIVIEGHTDNVPINTKKFRNNWELSTERALAVLEFILEDKNLNPLRFSATGYSEYRPVVPNDTKENRALNRRVDIVVIPMAQGGSSDKSQDTSTGK